MDKSMRAFVFPGQGSQFVGMGKDLYEMSPEARQRFDEANTACGGELLSVMFEGPEEKLRQTSFTQPALLVCSAVLSDALRQRGVEPSLVAGHSLGEYAALYAAGVLEFSEVLQLVVLRAKLMQRAGDERPGAMAAILGLEDDFVRKLCSESSHVVVVANYNSPGQLVISGDKEGVAEVSEKCKAAGARRVLPLPVSGAFHSPLLQEAGEKLAEAIAGANFRDSQIPIVMNVSAGIRRTKEEIRQELSQQMTSSVLWTESVRTMVAHGVTEFVEVGPGNVLAGLIKRIHKDAVVRNVGTREQLEKFCG